MPFFSLFSLRETKRSVAPIRASLENHPEHPGTGSKEIVTWLDGVNEIRLEASCPSVTSEMWLMTEPVDSAQSYAQESCTHPCDGSFWGEFGER